MVDVTPGWGEPCISVSFMLHLMWSCYQIYVRLMCYILCWILCVPSLSFVHMKCYVLCCNLCIKLCAPNMLDPMLHLLWTESCLRAHLNVYVFILILANGLGEPQILAYLSLLLAYLMYFISVLFDFASMWGWVMLDFKIHIILSEKSVNKPILEIELHGCK